MQFEIVYALGSLGEEPLKDFFIEEMFRHGDETSKRIAIDSLVALDTEDGAVELLKVMLRAL